ncbi:MAG: hypothetical protein ACLRWP_13200 [Bilophila wadsworthia]
MSELNRAGSAGRARRIGTVVNRSLFYGALTAEFDVTVQPVIDLPGTPQSSAS